MLSDTNPEQDVGSPFPRVRELPYYSWTEFDSISLVKATLRHLEQGMFDTPAQLVDMMTRDDRLGGCLDRRASALSQLPRTIKKGTGKNARRLAKVFEDNFETFFPDEQLAQLEAWALMCGLGVAELVWYRDPATKTLMFRLKTWHPRFIYWRWDTRSYWLMTEGDTREISTSTGQWLLLAPWGLERSWMYGLMRRLYIPWLLRQWSLRDSGRYSEAYGGPVKKAYMPAGAKDAEKNRFLAAVARLSSDSALRLVRSANPEQGYDFDFAELKGTGFQIFSNLEERTNSAIAITILGQNLTTEVKSGALASTSIHKLVESSILKSDAARMASTLREQAIAAYARFNFGEVRDEELPTPEWDTEQPESKKERADTMKAVGDGVAALKLAGFTIDVEKVQEEYDLPIDETAEFNDEVPGAAGAEEPDGDEGEPGTEKKKPGAEQFSKHVVPSKADVLSQMRLRKIEEEGAREGATAMKPMLEKLLTAIEQAADFTDLEDRVRKIYAVDDDETLASLMTAALALSELEGRFAAVENG